ncbi:MAG: S1C family serine protease [Euzebya sp.]
MSNGYGSTSGDLSAPPSRGARPAIRRALGVAASAQAGGQGTLERMPQPSPHDRVRPGVPLRVVGMVAAVAGLVGVLAGIAAVSLWSPQSSPSLPVAESTDRVSSVAAVVLPSVVRVDVRGIGEGGTGNASGVVIDDQGHIVTNHHVVAGVTGISVTFADGSRVPASLVGSDPNSDLAVIEVEETDHPPITLADPREIMIGQLAVVVGSPFGLNGSVTAGVISAVDRPIDLRGVDGELVRLPGVLQTDAGINPGNSGGPLVDGQGRLLGINSAMLGEDLGGEVGFAIPVGIVTDVVASLIAEGRVPTPFLGLSGSTVRASRAEELGIEGGALVEDVQPGTPAAQAGLNAGDVVVAVNTGGVRTMADVIQAVRGAGVGATIEVRYIRGNAVQIAQVTLVDATDR